MVAVLVSIGSNIDRDVNVAAAVAALRARFGQLTLSSVYETAAVGFHGAAFYNLVARFETDMTPQGIAGILREIEDERQRDRSAPKMGSRTLDLDLLLYGDLVTDGHGLELPRREIMHHAFVLRPLAELAGDTRHPTNGRTFAELWAAFDAEKQRTRRLRMAIG